MSDDRLTMKVRVDGEIVERVVEGINMEDPMMRYIPEIGPNEIIDWTHGDDVPTIIRVR